MSRANDQRFIRGLLAALCLLAVVALFAWVGQVAAAEPVIPQASAAYRLQVQRAAGEYFGLDAPAARLAAQIHQESAWRPDARSAYAWGLSQFTPATAKWLPEICPELGEFDPWNASQSVRAMACYDAWLHQRVKPFPWGSMSRSIDTRGAAPAFNLVEGHIDACARWMFALRAYNGGEGWINRERRAAAAQGWNPNRWSEVEKVRLRADWAHRENTRYPLRILHILEPAYLKAGWPGQAVC
jgi:hypothetical protein